MLKFIFEKKREKSLYKGRFIKPKHNQWSVQFNVNKNNNRGNSRAIYLRNLIKNNQIKKINYSNYVYGITVKNHTLWVRRNNICVWVGNCTHCYQNKMKELNIRSTGAGNPSVYFDKRGNLKRELDDFMWYLKFPNKIYNVSLQSHIHQFERIDYNTFFSLLKK